jgi:hypothetical protein
MNFPFWFRNIDLNDYESVRKHATYLPSAEAAWPIRKVGFRTPEERLAKRERVRRLRAYMYRDEAG